jgi:putative DNA primase/helicase
MNALEAALNYAHRGWMILPCWPGDKTPCLGAERDAAGRKIPKTGGLYKATSDEALIHTWWRRWPYAMIGVRCGAASGIWAIDPDAPKKPGDVDGKANWAALRRQHGCDPTHTHLTPGGGEHFVFKWRPDKPVTNSEGSIKRTGINVRGESGYIIAPPSRRGDGKAYEIAEPLDFFKFADAPDWLYELLRPPPRRTARTFRASTSWIVGNSSARMQGILNKVATAGEGDRNKILFWGAMRVVDMVNERVVPPSEGDRAFEALIDAASHAGLTEAEIVRTLQSARARA